MSKAKEDSSKAEFNKTFGGNGRNHKIDPLTHPVAPRPLLPRELTALGFKQPSIQVTNKIKEYTEDPDSPFQL